MDYYYELLNSYSKLKKRTLVLKEEETASKEKTYTPANPVQGDATTFLNNIASAEGNAGTGSYDHPTDPDKQLHVNVNINQNTGKTNVHLKFGDFKGSIGSIVGGKLVLSRSGSRVPAQLDAWLEGGELGGKEQEETKQRDQAAAELEARRQAAMQNTATALDELQKMLMKWQNQITSSRDYNWKKGTGKEDWRKFIEKSFEELKTSNLISEKRKLEMANTLVDLAKYMMSTEQSGTKGTWKPRMNLDQFNDLMSKISIDPKGSRIYLLDPDTNEAYQVGIFKGKRATQTIAALKAWHKDAIEDVENNRPGTVSDFQERTPAAESDGRNIGRRGLAAEAIRVMGTTALNILKGGDNKAFYLAKLKDLYADATTRKEDGSNVSQIIVNEFVAAAGFIKGTEFLTDGVEGAVDNMEALKSFMIKSMGMSESEVSETLDSLAEDEGKALLFSLVMDMSVSKSLFGGVTPLGGAILGGEIDAKTGESYQSRGSKADLRYFFNNNEAELEKVGSRLKELGLDNPQFVVPTEEQWEKMKDQVPEGTDRESVRVLDGVSLKTLNSSSKEIVMGSGSNAQVSSEIAHLHANPDHPDYPESVKKHYREVSSQVGDRFEGGEEAVKELAELTQGMNRLSADQMVNSDFVHGQKGALKDKTKGMTSVQKQKVAQGHAMFKYLKKLNNGTKEDKKKAAASVAYLWSLNAHSSDENAINLAHNLEDNSISITKDYSIRNAVMKGLSSGDLEVNLTDAGTIQFVDKQGKALYSIEGMLDGSMKCVQKGASRGESTPMGSLGDKTEEGTINSELLTLFLESQERLFKSLLERN